MKSFYLTDAGKVRDHNEDSVIIVKNKNNVIGLFNLITNKFYSNTGTGTEGFIAGNSLGKLSLIQENKIEEL